MTDVKSFGATGDGRTDDTSSLQHAIDDGGGLLVLPRGTYRITKPLLIDRIRSNRVGIDGQGGTATIRMDGPGPAIRILGRHDKTADPKDFRPQIWDRERMPTVHGVEILGGHDEADGIELEGTMQATITNVLIRRCRYGVRLVKRNRNVLLADSHIYDSRPRGIGVYFDGVNLHQTNIVGCHISYCRQAGIKVERSEVRNLQITGCDIEYNYEANEQDCADVWIDSRVGTVREVTIASNTIQAKESPGGSNIRIDGLDTPASHKTGLITITGNVLQSQAVNVRLTSCRGITLTGNTFATGFDRSIRLDNCKCIVIGSNFLDYNPDYEGHRVDGLSIKDSSGCVVSNMVVEACRAGTLDFGGSIEIERSTDIALNSIQVLDPAVRGIDLKDSDRCRISDVTVIDRRETKTMREAIRVSGTGKHNFVTGSLIGKGTSDALVVSGAPIFREANRII